jgi:hydrogenase maturation protease
VKVLIGIGNSYRGDDAAGLRVAEAVGGIALESPDAARILAAYEGATELVVVDAVESGAAPGSIHRLDASHRPLPASLFTSDSHHFGLAQAIELGRALGRLPDSVKVFGIEGRSFGFEEGISQEVGVAIDVLTRELGSADG